MSYPTKKDLEKELDAYREDCYECTGYGDDYYTDTGGELVCRCDTCYIRRHIQDLNQRIAEMEA